MKTADPALPVISEGDLVPPAAAASPVPRPSSCLIAAAAGGLSRRELRAEARGGISDYGTDDHDDPFRALRGLRSRVLSQS